MPQFRKILLQRLATSYNFPAEPFMRYFFVFLLLLVTSTPTLATEWRDSAAIKALFSSAGLTGTFVLYDVAGDTFTGHNRARAETRFIPASTFKIPNSLISLSVGVVKNVDEVLPYGGKPQPMKAWEKDMGLRDAIKVSNVPVYQELARRIGLGRMNAALAKLDYGNGDIGKTVDIFWLRGPLKISAIEQARFLKRLASGELPLPKATQAEVREILRIDQGEDWTLFAKTGLAANKQKVGWWVGWVEKSGRLYAFAINIDVRKPEDAEKRIELGKQSLKALGIL